MARLFTAIELDPATRDAVSAVQAAVVRELRTQGNEGLRPVRPEHLHLTLVFIGEVEESRVPAFVEAMRSDVPVAPFDVGFAGCGVFPPRGPARVLWLGIERGASGLTRVFEEIASRCEALGVPRESRPYSPHLTIGRFRDGARGRLHLPDVGAIATENVGAVTLFRSTLQPGGPEHTAIASARLTGGAPPLH